MLTKVHLKGDRLGNIGIGGETVLKYVLDKNTMRGFGLDSSGLG